MGTYFTPSASLLLEMMAALTASMIYILNRHTHICTYVYEYTVESIFFTHIGFPKGSALMLQTQA